MKGLLGGGGTAVMAVLDGSWPGIRASGFVGESLGDGDTGERRFPVGDVVFSF
jgi:hypothetical protein